MLIRAQTSESIEVLIASDQIALLYPKSYSQELVECRVVLKGQPAPLHLWIKKTELEKL